MSLTQVLTPPGGVVLTNANIDGNGTFELWNSATINNSTNQTGFDSLRIVANFSDLENVSNNGSQGPVDISGGITVVAEAQANGIWYPIAYQFSPLQNFNEGNQRVIILQPNMSTFDDGIDSIVYVADATIARLSRQQGRVGPAFRIRVLCRENAFNGSLAFKSVRMSLIAELFNA